MQYLNEILNCPCELPCEGEEPSFQNQTVVTEMHKKLPLKIKSFLLVHGYHNYQPKDKRFIKQLPNNKPNKKSIYLTLVSLNSKNQFNSKLREKYKQQRFENQNKYSGKHILSPKAGLSTQRTREESPTDKYFNNRYYRRIQNLSESIIEKKNQVESQASSVSSLLKHLSKENQAICTELENLRKEEEQLLLEKEHKKAIFQLQQHNLRGLGRLKEASIARKAQIQQLHTIFGARLLAFDGI